MRRSFVSVIHVLMWTGIGGLCFANPGAGRAAGAVDLDVERFNYVLGTQAFNATYQFTSQPLILELAQAIRDMGSNTIKFALSRRYASIYGVPEKESIQTLTDLAAREPFFRRVFDMPFTYYFMWTYAFQPGKDAYFVRSFNEEERKKEYREIYELTRHFLTACNGTGKRFFLGQWEGDWHLSQGIDPKKDPTDQAIAGMTAWLNTRQQAVDDARRDTPHKDVDVFVYAEVNLVEKAMTGARAMTNSVLPRVNVDYVSFSSWSSSNVRKEDGDDLSKARERMIRALNYIESKLPPKPAIQGKRVFVGEYGAPLIAAKTPEEQDRRARAVARVALEWGCPFVLYWQMYCNEWTPDKSRRRGFWLIDENNVEEPIYNTYRDFLAKGRQFVADFKAKHGRVPTDDEYRRAAVEWLR